MDTNKLIRMANQIGDFFVSMPDREEALEGIAGHLKRFWEPRMRTLLLAHVEQTGGAGLNEIVLAAIRANEAMLAPQAASTAHPDA